MYCLIMVTTEPVPSSQDEHPRPPSQDHCSDRESGAGYGTSVFDRCGGSSPGVSAAYPGTPPKCWHQGDLPAYII